MVETHQHVSRDYRTQQSSLASKIIKIVSTYYPVMEQASNIISEVDVLLTFA